MNKFHWINMEEKTVRKIMSKYFKIKKRNAIPTRGAGPDFLEAGKAIEVKGSGVKGSRFNKAIGQFANYAFKYSDLEVAFPIDLLTANNLIKFTLLCRIVWKVLSKRIKTHLIAEDGQQYYVKTFDNGEQVLNVLLDRIPELSDFKDERFQDAIVKIEACLSLVDITIRDTLLDEVSGRPDMTLLAGAVK